MHVGAGRVINTKVSTGGEDSRYLADFEEAWMLLMKNLKPQHRNIFKDEIDYRLSAPEFHNCGTLGKEYIL